MPLHFAEDVHLSKDSSARKETLDQQLDEALDEVLEEQKPAKKRMRWGNAYSAICVGTSTARGLSVDARRAVGCFGIILGQFQEHTLYELEVKSQETGRTWRIKRRFSEFYHLHRYLASHHKQIPAMPPKKPWKSTDKKVVAQRRISLVKFVNGCLTDKELMANFEMYGFLDDYTSMPVDMPSAMKPEAAKEVVSILKKRQSAQLWKTTVETPSLTNIARLSKRLSSGLLGSLGSLATPFSPDRRTSSQRGFSAPSMERVKEGTLQDAW